MAFYKLEEGELFEAPNFVYAPTYTLLAENSAEYTYPVDGWLWFDSYALAAEFFGLPDREE